MQPSLQPTLDLNVDHKEISRLYKSQLQIYAQKKKLAMPIYSYETDGPPHARRFKSTVMIDGISYTAAELYSTIKEAENTAAKVALESLSGIESHEDASLHKSLLQELTQKEGFGAPIYETVKSGPPHMPLFVSTVRIKGKVFQGQEANMKKQAEMSAAKTVYDSLTDCRLRSPGIASEVSYYRLKPTISNESPVAVTNEHLHPSPRAQVENFGQNKQPNKDVKTNEEESKPLVSSPLSDVIHGHPQFPSTSALPGNGSAFPSLTSEYFADSGSNINRVIVCPQHPNPTYPQDSTILPCTDEKWVAVAIKYEINSSH